jgi:hypothetical protein
MRDRHVNHSRYSSSFVLTVLNEKNGIGAFRGQASMGGFEFFGR